MIKTVKTWLAGVTDLVVPRFCVMCRRNGEPGRTPYVCSLCEGGLALSGSSACLRCGAWTGPSSGDSCPECRGKRFRFVRAVAVGPYAGGLRDLILRLKFHRAAYLAVYFAHLLAEGLRQTDVPGQVGSIVPVPMGRWKSFWRGYNQAELIADHLGRNLKLPVVRNALIKIKTTPPQSALHREQRRHNVRGAFGARTWNIARGQSVLLVDDILTTGATANECAEALTKAGTGSVYVAVIGR